MPPPASVPSKDSWGTSGIEAPSCWPLHLTADYSRITSEHAVLFPWKQKSSKSSGNGKKGGERTINVHQSCSRSTEMACAPFPGKDVCDSGPITLCGLYSICWDPAWAQPFQQVRQAGVHRWEAWAEDLLDEARGSYWGMSLCTLTSVPLDPSKGRSVRPTLGHRAVFTSAWPPSHTRRVLGRRSRRLCGNVTIYLATKPTRAMAARPEPCALHKTPHQPGPHFQMTLKLQP